MKTRTALWMHARRIDDVTTYPQAAAKSLGQRPENTEYLVPSSPGLNLSFVPAPPSHPTLWRPEYGSYMIEGTPGQPYGGTMSEFNTVEDNMDKRRREASAALKENETLCTVTAFPR